MFTHTKKIVNPASGNKDFDIQLQKKNPRKTQAMHANKKGHNEPDFSLDTLGLAGNSMAGKCGAVAGPDARGEL